MNENLPVSANGVTLQLTPAVTARKVTVNSSLSSSVEIVLASFVSLIRVYATNQDVFLKWGADNATTSSFDEVIPAGGLLDFVVPKGTTALNLIERTAGAAVVVIEK